METCKSIWLNGKLVPWDEAKVHVLTHALHYGGGAFEGVRAYKTDKGPAIFKLEEHTKRLFYSTNALKMEIPFSEDQVNQAIIDTINDNGLEHCYIRPLAYYGYGKMGLNPKGAPSELLVACWPWGAYLPHEMIDVKTSDYIRIHPRSTVADAKITGHYVNSILAVQALEGTKYHEALFLDFEGNVAEGPGENLFIVKDGKIYTPPLGTILAGITRLTMFELAELAGIEIIEKTLKLEDIYEADEAFYTGTAAEVTPIRSLDDKVIGDGELNGVTLKFRDAYQDIVHGRPVKLAKNGEEVSFDQYLTWTR